MANKLYVGNLSYSTSEEALRNAFGQAGTVVSASIIIDKMTNRPKGFGFVEMSSEAEMNAAKDMWNGKELDGRTLKVDEARPQEDRPRNGGFRRQGGYNNDRGNQ